MWRPYCFQIGERNDQKLVLVFQTGQADRAREVLERRQLASTQIPVWRRNVDGSATTSLAELLPFRQK